MTPSFWEIRTYEDFQKGKLSNLSLTSDDRLILAPRYDMIFDTQQTLDSVDGGRFERQRLPRAPGTMERSIRWIRRARAA